MNSPFNNSRAGVTLLEALVMLAIMALVMSVAASGFSGNNRPGSVAGILARVSQDITMARNQAILTAQEVSLPLSTSPALSSCDPTLPPIIQLFPDGTVLSPDLCLGSPTPTRIRVDWLTGHLQIMEQPGNG
ncbi:MAG: hypothetical protein L3J37_08670 [Rhodobacteraceae bacterium]|nr:hypothetical protein [Paracoccaceae bacterium]